MNDKDMLRYTCQRVNQIFLGSDVEVNSYYKLRHGNNGKSMKVIVEMKFMVDEDNLCNIESHVSIIRQITDVLSGGDMHNQQLMDVIG